MWRYKDQFLCHHENLGLLLMTDDQDCRDIACSLQPLTGTAILIKQDALIVPQSRAAMFHSRSTTLFCHSASSIQPSTDSTPSMYHDIDLSFRSIATSIDIYRSSWDRGQPGNRDFVILMLTMDLFFSSSSTGITHSHLHHGTRSNKKPKTLSLTCSRRILKRGQPLRSV